MTKKYVIIAWIVSWVVIGHLNIKSLCNNFDSLKRLVKNSLDAFMISVTKLDGTFPVGQFPMDGFVPLYRMQRNTNGGGAALYVKKKIYHLDKYR